MNIFFIVVLHSSGSTSDPCGRTIKFSNASIQERTSAGPSDENPFGNRLVNLWRCWYQYGRMRFVAEIIRV